MLSFVRDIRPEWRQKKRVLSSWISFFLESSFQDHSILRVLNSSRCWTSFEFLKMFNFFASHRLRMDLWTQWARLLWSDWRGSVRRLAVRSSGRQSSWILEASCRCLLDFPQRIRSQAEILCRRFWLDNDYDYVQEIQLAYNYHLRWAADSTLHPIFGLCLFFLRFGERSCGALCDPRRGEEGLD